MSFLICVLLLISFFYLLLFSPFLYLFSTRVSPLIPPFFFLFPGATNLERVRRRTEGELLQFDQDGQDNPTTTDRRSFPVQRGRSIFRGGQCQ